MKEARHLVSHLWLTAPRRTKHNVTSYQAGFLGVGCWRLQQQDPSLSSVHFSEKPSSFLHWNFRYQRKHSMSEHLLKKINSGKTSSPWHPIQQGPVLQGAVLVPTDAHHVPTHSIPPARGKGGRRVRCLFKTQYLYHSKS